MIRLRRGREGGPGDRSASWSCPFGLEKLRARATLPGAYGFDYAAHALGLARRTLAIVELLPLAFASSWLVNNAVPSPVFRRWLQPEAMQVWSELVEALSGGPETWLGYGREERDVLLRAAQSLAVDGHGAGALSKVLALLAPDAVPLMPDAALGFALGNPPRPAAPDAQTTSVDAFVPMMDWFTRETLSGKGALEALATAHGPPSFFPAQVLDRLVWFDSVGYRHFRSPQGPRWWWVKDGEREAVIPMAAPHLPPPPAEEPVDLQTVAKDGPCGAFRDAALRALEG